MKKRLLVLLAISLCAFGSTASAQAADTVHRGPNWSWTGPSNWIASYGTYGITVSSPSQSHAIDWGFAAILCYPGNTLKQQAARFANAQRTNMALSPKLRFTDVGPVRLTSGGFYRQVNLYKATIKGKRFRGQATFDYSSYDGTYCNQSSRVMQAPAKNFCAGLRKLHRIYHSMAYSGPGAIEDK